MTIPMMASRNPSTIHATNRAPVLENVNPGATSCWAGTGVAQPTPGGSPVSGVGVGVDGDGEGVDVGVGVEVEGVVADVTGGGV